MLADAGAALVLASAATLDRVPAAVASLVLDAADERAALAALPATAPTDAERGRPLLADDLAYVIYTSGSTGTAQGRRRSPIAGVVNRLLWMQDALPASTPADRVLQKTPFSFDVSVWELFWPLLVGARLVLARPEGHKRPGATWSSCSREQAVTMLHFVPSMLQAFLEAAGPRPAAPRCAA